METAMGIVYAITDSGMRRLASGIGVPNEEPSQIITFKGSLLTLIFELPEAQAFRFGAEFGQQFGPSFLTKPHSKNPTLREVELTVPFGDQRRVLEFVSDYAKRDNLKLEPETPLAV